LPSRGWFINPLTRSKGKWWLIFAAIIPALLATILIFMDQHITAVIVNRKGNKLKVIFLKRLSNKIPGKHLNSVLN
jgi:hypothetical protein